AILRRCDQEGVAAYGECTTLGSRRLFERCGFRPLPEVVLPDGTRIHPVWRAPRSGARGHHEDGGQGGVRP
ncbi:hypothetical protein ACH4RC_42165, partial [Streptomyces sp. NPDC016845]